MGLNGIPVIDLRKLCFMSQASPHYQQYITEMRKIADIRYASAVLQWDQETYLPAKGADFRGQQIATLSSLAHEFFTSQKMGQLLKTLSEEDGLTEDQRANVVLSLLDYERHSKIPTDLVERMSVAVHKSFHSWMKGRQENDFSVFAPDLSEILQLKKEESALLGYEKNPYDAHLNDHDKGSSVALLDQIFTNLKPALKSILDKILSKPVVEDGFLRQHFPKNQQWEFGIQVLKDMGYDFEAGRQDVSEHPFTINFNSKDVRVTTRIDEQDFSNMLWSCIHEGGHALYEQALPEAEYGLPLSEAASFSIHESQSRLWENQVGRSWEFCQHYFPILKELFPKQFAGISTEEFYKAINKVSPSLIRTEADELTYHFHVMIRYEIEKLLFDGAISVHDIPEYWNAHYESYLGVAVPDHKRGCLQDVHWSHGSFGYFPTYSLGSMYGAQFYTQAATEIPLLSTYIRNGSFQPLLQWLNGKVHIWGRKYDSESLSLKISGKGLDPSIFTAYLLDKYMNIYNI